MIHHTDQTAQISMVFDETQAVIVILVILGGRQ